MSEFDREKCAKQNNPMAGALMSCFFGTEWKCKDQLCFSDDDDDNNDDDDDDDDVGREKVALAGGRRPVCPEESSKQKSSNSKQKSRAIKMFNNDIMLSLRWNF